MNRKTVKKVSAFLLALTLAGTTAYAEEGALGTAEWKGVISDGSMEQEGTVSWDGADVPEGTLPAEEIAGAGEMAPWDGTEAVPEEAAPGEGAGEPIPEEETADGADGFIIESEEGAPADKYLIARPSGGSEMIGGLRYVYEFDDDGRATLTGCESENPESVTKLELPLSVGDGYPLMRLAGGALQQFSNLEEILLPYYMELVPSNAFYGCRKLKTVIMPRGMKLFYKNAFHDVPGLTIYGVAGTYAEQRAREYGIPFVAREEVLATKLDAPETPMEINQGEHIVPEAFCTVIEPSDCTEELKFTWRELRVLSDCNPLLGLRAGRDAVITKGKNVSTSRDVVVHGRLEMTQQAVRIGPDETVQLALTYNDEPLDASQVQWTSWDSHIASVQNGQNGGLVKGIATGNAYISATYGNSAAICKVAVVGKPKFTVKGFVGGRTVSISSPYGNGVYYSFTSSDMSHDAQWLKDGGTLTFDKSFYGTLYAKGFYNDGLHENWSDASKLVLQIPQVNAPTITQSGDTVTIKTTTPSCTICYTTDGSEPSTQNGTMIRSSTYSFFAPKGTSTIKAIAVRSCFANSETASKTVTGSGNNPESASNAYNVSRDMGVPSFGVKGVIGGRNVTFKSATAGSRIYFSCTTSSLTTNDESVANGGTVLFENYYGTIYARAYKDGVWSNVARLILKIPVVNKPTVTRSGDYVTIRTTTPNCALYYTTDGTNPSPNHGTRISGSSGKVALKQGSTIKVIAVRSCFTSSPIAVYK